jgi:hypothetical protein
MLIKFSRAISSVNWLKLTRLMTREDSINFNRLDSFRSYK